MRHLLGFLILSLAFLSSAPTDPEARAGLADAGYSLFRRYGLGIISTWDVLFFGSIAILLINNFFSKEPANLFDRAFRNKTLNMYFLLLAISIVVGLTVNLCFQSDVFVFKDWFRAIVPVVYMVLMYFFVVNVVKNEDDLMRVWNLLQIIAVIMVFYGFYRLYVILIGQIKTLRPGDIPIILYSELVSFDLPILTYCASIWAGKRLGVMKFILLLLMIGFILASTRRFNYLMLVIGMLIVFLIGRKSRLFNISMALIRTRYIIALIVIGMVILIYQVPTLLDGIWFAIQTINMFSETGYEYTGAFRIVQIENIFLNFTDLPITWLTGYGIGTKWHVIRDLPTTTDLIGSYMAFDANVSAGGTDWLPYFHVPYFSTLFRFGLFGFAFLIVIIISLYRKNISMIRQLEGKNVAALMTALLALILMCLLVNGDSTNPTGYLWPALYMGLMESCRLSFSREQRP